MISNEEIRSLAQRAEPDATEVVVKVWQVRGEPDPLWRAGYTAKKRYGRTGLDVPAATEEGARERLAESLHREIADNERVREIRARGGDRA